MDHQDVKLMSKTSTNSSPDHDIDNSTAKIEPEVPSVSQHSDQQTDSSSVKPKVVASMLAKVPVKDKIVSTTTEQKNEKDQQQKQKKQADQPLDVITELVQKQNPLPLLAVLDQVDLYRKTNDGVPLFNLLMNKFLPLPQLLDNLPIKFEKDEDGRTPLHYAIEADDVKATQWLLSKEARNESDKFGNTPVMDSVRLGHKRCFLLCLHYQHVSQNLPHTAAQYNRVWQLKCMLALGLSLQNKNSSSKTPLQVAVQSYSYQAAEYLAYVTNNYLISSLKTLTDSKAIIRRVHEGAQKSSTLHRAILPLLSKIIQVLLLVCLVNYSHYFQGVSQMVNYNVVIMVITELMMLIVGCLLRSKIKTPESITKLLHQPYFPNNLDHVCPSCFNRYHPQKQEHCEICHICVPKLHQHHYMCINKHNQAMWYIEQYLYLYTLYMLVTKTIAFTLQTYPPPIPFQSLLPSIINFSYTVHHMHQSQSSYLLPICFIVITGLFIKQFLFCLQLFGMAFMNRTYREVVQTQKYPHLYEVFKSKSGKVKTKEYRIFGKYKLCGGVCVGIRNIIRFFIC